MYNYYQSQSLKDITCEYPILSEFITKHNSSDIAITNKFSKLKIGKVPKLKYYFHDENTDKIIKNNLDWALGKSTSPQFQFVYLMLPTKCNLACHGCFMGQDKKLLPENFLGDVFKKAEIKNISNYSAK